MASNYIFNGTATGQFARRLLTCSTTWETTSQLTVQMLDSGDRLRQNAFAIVAHHVALDQCWFVGINNGVIGTSLDTGTQGFIIGQYSYGGTVIHSFTPMTFNLGVNYVITATVHGPINGEVVITGALSGGPTASITLTEEDVPNQLTGFGTFQGVIAPNSYSLRQA